MEVAIFCSCDGSKGKNNNLKLKKTVWHLYSGMLTTPSWDSRYLPYSPMPSLLHSLTVLFSEITKPAKNIKLVSRTLHCRSRWVCPWASHPAARQGLLTAATLHATFRKKSFNRSHNPHSPPFNSIHTQFRSCHFSVGLVGKDWN